MASSLIQRKQLAANARPGINATGNSAMVASTTVADGDAATATAVAADNFDGSRLSLYVNGVRYNIGDGTKVGVPAYISGDGGATARAFSAIVATDTIRWNGTVAGFQLAATTDILDLDGMIVEP
jgi:hypothetical protein